MTDWPFDDAHPERVLGPWIVADLSRGQVMDQLHAAPLYAGHGWISGSAYWLSHQEIPAELQGVTITHAFDESILVTIATAEKTMRETSSAVAFGTPFADGPWPRARVTLSDGEATEWLVNPNYVWWLERQHSASTWRLGDMGTGRAFFLLGDDDELCAIVAPCRQGEPV